MSIDPVDLRRGAVAEAIRAQRLIVVLRRVEPQSALLSLVAELVDAGVRAFEITFDSPSAAADLRALRDLLAGRVDGPFVTGAGTLLRGEQVTAAREAGAQFGVSPVLDLEMTRKAVESGFPFVPGAMTPTEMRTAWAAGATFVKLFPASAVGPQFIRELRGPLPEIQVIPSGGVDGDNAIAFLEAGAVAVGLSSAIVRMTAGERRALVESVRRP
ncbi:MAG TPA: bifunctional 4-hydroxy-2-oxoglutarate aldolase/2-dehydro-3-deoxy-phosphogluconate aldolase [Candidatus Limnocylindrales bacterium]|nr:bifunctional 4-hydroxy-2-oxoglutarate aldolase/2-dehydro-3-deoxy-phosphogluconate aldolase [Candidatus Limnocylindrales bacterium]